MFEGRRSWDEPVQSERTPSRMVPRALSERRRTRRLSPGVLFLTLLMIAGTLAFTSFTVAPDARAASVSPDCIPCPGGGGCYPNCGGGGGCPTGTIGITVTMLAVNPTNVTLRFTLSTNATVYMFWGNNSNFIYDFTQINDVRYNNNQLTQTVFLDFLEPQTKYYYKITASSYCWNPGTKTGNWTTGTDSSLTISGYVYGPDGTTPATANVAVFAYCMEDPGLNVVTSTDSNGHYSLNLALLYDMPCWASFGPGWRGTYGVTAGAPGDPSGGWWKGHWNETVVLWAPQIVDFSLPVNYISPFFPKVLDFSNAPSGYSTIQYAQGSSVSYTTSMGYTWSISGGSGEANLGFSGSSSTSKTYSVSSSSTLTQLGGTLDYVIQMQTSGTIEFNALIRSWAETQVNLYGDMLNGNPAVQVPSFQQPADWLTPQTMNNSADTYFIWNDAASKYMEDVYDSAAGFLYGGGVTTSVTNSAESSYSINFGVTASLSGAGSAGLSVGATWSQESSYTYSENLEYSIGMTTGGSPFCFDVIGQGGSSPMGGTTTADMFGIYVWAPTPQGTCATP